jgi:hypothetical protein
MTRIFNAWVNYEHPNPDRPRGFIMGVEHYLVCGECKEYIDLHKAYEFSHVIGCRRPPVGVECAETGFNDPVFKGGYWAARGLWFLWTHREHKNVHMQTDCNDSWYDQEPYLKEVFSHKDDIKIRERIASKP